MNCYQMHSPKNNMNHSIMTWERRSPRKENSYLPTVIGIVLFLGAVWFEKTVLTYEVLTKGFGV